jgi:hypothetical protein
VRRARLFASRKNGSFDLPVPVVREVAQDLRQTAERFFMVHDVASSHGAISNELKGTANVVRSVMKAGFAGDFTVVQQVGIERHFSAAGATTEEINSAALTDELSRELPDLGMTDGFYHYISSSLSCAGAHLRNDSSMIAHENTFSGAKHNGSINLLEASRDGDDPRTERPFSQANEHQADGSEAHDGDRVTRLKVTFMQTTQHASKRLYESSVFIRELGGYGVGIGSNDAFRQTHELSVRSVIEQEIFAEVLLIVPAEEASVTWSGVGRYNPLSDVELRYTFADRDNIASHFMAEERRGNDHFGVISAPKDFHIRTASESGADTDQQFTGANAWDGY